MSPAFQNRKVLKWGIFPAIVQWADKIYCAWFIPGNQLVWRLRSTRAGRHNGTSLSPIITLSLILCTDNACHVALFALDECVRKKANEISWCMHLFFTLCEWAPLEMVWWVSVSCTLIKLILPTAAHICNTGKVILDRNAKVAWRWSINDQPSGAWDMVDFLLCYYYYCYYYGKLCRLYSYHVLHTTSEAHSGFCELLAVRWIWLRHNWCFF